MTVSRLANEADMLVSVGVALACDQQSDETREPRFSFQYFCNEVSEGGNNVGQAKETRLGRVAT